MATQVIAENITLFPSKKNFIYQSKNAYFDMTKFVSKYSNELTSERGMMVPDIIEKLEELNISMTSQMLGKVFTVFCDKSNSKIDSKFITFYKLKPDIEVPEYISSEDPIMKIESNEAILKENLHLNKHIDKDSKSFDIYIMIMLAYMKTDKFQSYTSKSMNMNVWARDLYEQMTKQDYESSNKSIIPSFAEKWLLNRKLAKLLPNYIPPKITFKINELEFKACIQLVITNLDSKYHWSIDTKNRYDKFIVEQNRLAELRRKAEEERKLKEEEQRHQYENSEEYRKQQEENTNKELEERRQNLIKETNQHNADLLHITYDEYVNFYNKFKQRFQRYEPVEYYTRLHKYDGKDLSTFKVKKSTSNEYYFLYDNYLQDFYWILGELKLFDPESEMITILNTEIDRRNKEIEDKKKAIEDRHQQERETNLKKINDVKLECINFCKDKAEHEPYLSMFGKERFRKIHWNDKRQILWYTKNRHDEDDYSHPIIIWQTYEINENNLNDPQYVDDIIRSYNKIRNSHHAWEKQLEIKKTNDPRYTLGDLMMQIIKEEVKHNTKELKKLIEDVESSDNIE